ncbi:MAG TPA: hypothetical protein VN653_10315, partial [Anaerolineales bacterium]|nr:hypothetical protein [Anaerolineales bacterium]
MTTKFGRTTLSQMLMLALAGIDDSINRVEIELSDEEKMNRMALGRKLLQKMTGMDFGFDLTIWRNFFMTNDEYEYKHPYAFENVDKAIQLAILDTNRKQIIDMREKRANELLNMLLKSQLISFSNNSARNIPETNGVYRIVESDLIQKDTVYIGQSKNIRSHLKIISKGILRQPSKPEHG